jgi:hypothetical protein
LHGAPKPASTENSLYITRDEPPGLPHRPTCTVSSRLASALWSRLSAATSPSSAAARALASAASPAAAAAAARWSSSAACRAASSDLAPSMAGRSMAAWDSGGESVKKWVRAAARFRQGAVRGARVEAGQQLLGVRQDALRVPTFNPPSALLHTQVHQPLSTEHTSALIRQCPLLQQFPLHTVRHTRAPAPDPARARARARARTHTHTRTHALTHAHTHTHTHTFTHQLHSPSGPPARPSAAQPRTPPAPAERTCSNTPRRTAPASGGIAKGRTR